MAKVKMLNMAGAEVGEVTLNDEIFGIEPNEIAVQTVVKNYLANQRQGTQSAKTRSEVRGGGRKPFRQKGTGRHRQGSTTVSYAGRWWNCFRTKAKGLQICSS